jgi:hypothetical protein
VRDADGSHLWDWPARDAEDLVQRGHAKKFGTRRVAYGVILLVPLENSAVEEIERAKEEQRSLTAASYGTRYVYREHLCERYYVHSLKGLREDARRRGRPGESFPLLSLKMNEIDFLRVALSIQAGQSALAAKS